MKSFGYGFDDEKGQWVRGILTARNEVLARRALQEMYPHYLTDEGYITVFNGRVHTWLHKEEDNDSI